MCWSGVTWSRTVSIGKSGFSKDMLGNDDVQGDLPRQMVKRTRWLGTHWSRRVGFTRLHHCLPAFCFCLWVPPFRSCFLSICMSPFGNRIPHQASSSNFLFNLLSSNSPCRRCLPTCSSRLPFLLPFKSSFRICLCKVSFATFHAWRIYRVREILEMTWTSGVVMRRNLYASHFSCASPNRGWTPRFSHRASSWPAALQDASLAPDLAQLPSLAPSRQWHPAGSARTRRHTPLPSHGNSRIGCGRTTPTTRDPPSLDTPLLGATNQAHQGWHNNQPQRDRGQGSNAPVESKTWTSQKRGEAGRGTAGRGGTGPGGARRSWKGRRRGGAVRPGHDLSISTFRTEGNRPGRVCGTTNVLNPM